MTVCPPQDGKTDVLFSRFRELKLRIFGRFKEACISVAQVPILLCEQLDIENHNIDMDLSY